MQNIVKRALDFAEKAHKGQYGRYSNKPYITHPVAVSSQKINQGRWLVFSRA